MFILCFGLTSEFLKMSILIVRGSKLSVFSKPFRREVTYLVNCIVVYSMYLAQK